MALLKYEVNEKKKDSFYFSDDSLRSLD